MLKTSELIVAIAAVVALSACGEGVAPPPPGRDMGEPMDDGPFDAGPDLGPPPDEGPLPDLGTGDAGPPDNFEGWGPGEEAVCEQLDGGPPAPTGCVLEGDCEAGEVCIAGGCEGRYCARAGVFCPPADCGADATCQNGVCVANSGVGECADPRACPPGHFCEIQDGGLGICVDRRLPCVGNGGCPSTHTCRIAGGAGHRYCLPTLFPCTVGGSDCFEGQCLDVGQDRPLCYPPSGECSSHFECTEDGERCSVAVRDGERECNRQGPCTANDQCADGYECLDVHLMSAPGVDIRVCHPPSPTDGTDPGCRTDLDCPNNSLCFDHDDNGLATCVCFNPQTSRPVSCSEL